MLYVGRLDQAKGVDRLLDAWARVGRTTGRALTIAGDGPLAHEWRPSSEPIPTVRWLGQISHRRLPMRWGAAVRRGAVSFLRGISARGRRGIRTGSTRADGLGRQRGNNRRRRYRMGRRASSRRAGTGSRRHNRSRSVGEGTSCTRTLRGREYADRRTGNAQIGLRRCRRQRSRPWRRLGSPGCRTSPSRCALGWSGATLERAGHHRPGLPHGVPRPLLRAAARPARSGRHRPAVALRPQNLGRIDPHRRAKPQLDP